jgi:hypothetical protein
MYVTHEQFINKPIRKQKYVYNKEYSKKPKIKCACGVNTIDLNKHLKSSLHLTNIIKNHM